MLLDSILGIGNKLIDKLIPDPEAKAKAQLELATLAQNGELAKMANETDIYKTEQSNVTDRWKADAATDSWLAVNIRPLSLVAIFVGYFLFALMSAFGYNANEGYVNLLGQWGMLIMSAYFGGKTLENIIAMKTK
jgi:Holin of 3TMs, for gene-transfer release